MDIGRSPYRVHQCHKCLGDTEYYCISCPCDLCSQCKEKHVKYLKTIDHDVVSYRVQFNYIPTQENCARHPSNFHIKYCEPCKLPVCYHCTEHRNHSQIDVRTAFETKQQQHQETIHSIRSDALFYRPVLLHRIKADFKICQTQFSLYQSETIKKAKKLNDFIDKVLYDLLNNVFRDFNLNTDV